MIDTSAEVTVEFHGQQEASNYRVKYDMRASQLRRMSLAKLKAERDRTGVEHILGGPKTKDDFITFLLGREYPIQNVNYAIHVSGHAEVWESCRHCTFTFYECPDCKGSMRMGLHGRDHQK